VSLENPRIGELRRRVLADPTSIAFAQLAEEFRRAGSYEEAVRVCRQGLARHPSYLSARVTLGRALVELGALDDAQHELEFVLRAAPENLAAIRGSAEIHHRRGDMPLALEYYQRALAFARHDPELEETVEQIARQLGGGAAGLAEGLSFEEAQHELISAIEGSPGPSAESVAPLAPLVTPEPVKIPSVFTSSTGASCGDIAEPEDQPASVAPAQDDGLFDFDALLGALGEESDRLAPAPIEALLAASTSGLVEDIDRHQAFDLAAALDQAAEQSAEREEPQSGSGSAAGPETGDSLAALEASLRAHVPAAPPDEVLTAELEPRQQAIVDDLERWLDELVLLRSDPAEPS
jgi:tetratricopeptide (TPR) repeat protein